MSKNNGFKQQMRKLFCPANMGSVSVAGIELEPEMDENRNLFVEVPDHIAPLLIDGHGLSITPIPGAQVAQPSKK